MWEELDEFHESLTKIEESFYRLASHEEELRAFGLRRISRTLNLEKLYPLLESFPLQLSRSQNIIRIADQAKFKELSLLLEQTNLEALITRFLVKLRIAENERPSASPIFSVITISKAIFFRKQTTDIFADSDVSMESVLSGITRIKSLLLIISRDLKNRKNHDDEVFKPSNVNVFLVSVEIDNAIRVILDDSSLNITEREKLIEYLDDAKQELAKQNPAWKKVVGALVITATLLSGVAVAPQASENVNNAIGHILGSSINAAAPDNLKLPQATQIGSSTTTERTESDSTNSRTMTVTGDGLRLRENPDVDSTAIGTLAIGSTVSLHKKEGDWYKVQTTNDRLGWVSKKYVSEE